MKSAHPRSGVRIIFVLIASFIPVTGFASGLGAIQDTRLANLARKGSSYLLSAQLNDGGWAWDSRTQKRAENCSGLIAEALLTAYEQSGDDSYLNIADDYARILVARFTDSPSVLPFKPDIEFLVRMSEVGGNESYAATAAKWFNVIKRKSPTGSSEVARISSGRANHPSITGFDVALAIRAALTVSEREYAYALADAVLKSQAAWLLEPRSTFGTISRAALLDALLSLDRKRYDTAITRLRKELVTEQGSNGSWHDNETQATAYVVRALARFGDVDSRRAAKAGSMWLARTVLPNGRWAHFNDGLPEPFVGDVLPEVQAETLTALVYASRLR